jgi:hypothetical protein
MALPSLSVPEFFANIPSTGEEIKYRPFLVKEEKILLMALEGRDQKEISESIVKLLESCILTKIDIKKLATFDIEYLFLKLRGKSVGEIIEIKATHENSECKEVTPVVVNLDDITVKGEMNEGKIMITDKIGVKMRYPGMKDVINVNTADKSSMFNLVSKCVEYIFDENEVYNEFTEKEIVEWIEKLNQSQFKKISEFFENIPKLSHEIKWKCKACGKEDKMLVEGLQSFFT